MISFRRIVVSILSITSLVSPIAAQTTTAQPAAKLVIVPTANHVFRAATDDRMAQARLYTDPTIPVVPELSPAIADWIKRLK